jgi:hypothetical protein
MSKMPLVGSLKMNTTLEYSTRVVQEGDRRCKKSTLNDLAYLTPLRIPLMNPVHVCNEISQITRTVSITLILSFLVILCIVQCTCIAKLGYKMLKMFFYVCFFLLVLTLSSLSNASYDLIDFVTT